MSQTQMIALKNKNTNFNRIQHAEMLFSAHNEFVNG